MAQAKLACACLLTLAVVCAATTVAREFLTTPVQVIIGGSDTKLVANKDVTQIIHRCSSTEKEDKLVELLTGLDGDASIIILCAITSAPPPPLKPPILIARAPDAFCVCVG